MAWFSFGKAKIDERLASIDERLARLEVSSARELEADMATNDELQGIKAKLTEASTEIPAKLDELLAQVGDQADPQLVADIKGLAGGLADIVPNPEPETPAEEAPVDEASTPE